MDFIERRPVIAVAVAFGIGLFIGLVILGWGLWPVQWTDAGPQHLAPTDRDRYLLTVAELYSLDGNNPDKVRQSLAGWPDADQAICDLWDRQQDLAVQARLEAIAFVMNNQGCDGVAALPTDEAGADLGPILILLLLLLLFVGAILFVIQRRNTMMAEGRDFDTDFDVPDTAPMASEEGFNAIPLARFQSTYTFGRDTYDDSFSIENANGDFLGECGVGISESIGADTPKNVTAFEVWLFDKNDIRTVTKVIMSDHAFFDDALKAKLAPKGEPVLARENEVIVLETASLIINAEIRAMEYGRGTMPPQSYFENFTIELSAWAKEGEFDGPNVQDRVDEIMNY